jgi:hypothetical protein
MSYKIIRYFQKITRTETIKTGLTLKQAQDHCGKESTHKNGKWFDGYTKE